MNRYLLTGAGGFLGAVARLWVGAFITSRLGTRFPYGTLVINMSGCFVIGVVLAVLNSRPDIDPNWRFFFPIGFIGAYTTFSSFEYESFSSLQSGHAGVAVLYIGVSVVLGFVLVWAGVILGRMLS